MEYGIVFFFSGVGDGFALGGVVVVVVDTKVAQQLAPVAGSTQRGEKNTERE